MRIALISFANNNAETFPDDPGGPLPALSKLYPDYFGMGDEYALAGLSGDGEEAKRCLRNGKTLNSKASSWIYVNGLKSTDNPKRALIWEREFGIMPSGRRDGNRRRAVLLVGGDIVYVAKADWSQFERDQAALLDP